MPGRCTVQLCWRKNVSSSFPWFQFFGCWCRTLQRCCCWIWLNGLPLIMQQGWLFCSKSLLKDIHLLSMWTTIQLYWEEQSDHVYTVCWYAILLTEADGQIRLLSLMSLPWKFAMSCIKFHKFICRSICLRHAKGKLFYFARHPILWVFKNKGTSWGAQHKWVSHSISRTDFSNYLMKS